MEISVNCLCSEYLVGSCQFARELYLLQGAVLLGETDCAVLCCLALGFVFECPKG